MGLATERDTARPPVSGLNIDVALINKRRHLARLGRRARSRTAIRGVAPDRRQLLRPTQPNRPRSRSSAEHPRPPGKHQRRAVSPGPGSRSMPQRSVPCIRVGFGSSCATSTTRGDVPGLQRSALSIPFARRTTRRRAASRTPTTSNTCSCKRSECQCRCRATCRCKARWSRCG